jgi:hypothetical protein
MSATRLSEYRGNCIIEAIVDEARRDAQCLELVTSERARVRTFKCANLRSRCLLRAIRNILTEMAKIVLILSVPGTG